MYTFFSKIPDVKIYPKGIIMENTKIYLLYLFRIPKT